MMAKLHLELEGSSDRKPCGAESWTLSESLFEIEDLHQWMVYETEYGVLLREKTFGTEDLPCRTPLGLPASDALPGKASLGLEHLAPSAKMQPGTEALPGISPLESEGQAQLGRRSSGTEDLPGRTFLGPAFGDLPGMEDLGLDFWALCGRKPLGTEAVTGRIILGPESGAQPGKTPFGSEVHFGRAILWSVSLAQLGRVNFEPKHGVLVEVTPPGFEVLSGMKTPGPDSGPLPGKVLSETGRVVVPDWIPPPVNHSGTHLGWLPPSAEFAVEAETEAEAQIDGELPEQVVEAQPGSALRGSRDLLGKTLLQTSAIFGTKDPVCSGPP